MHQNGLSDTTDTDMETGGNDFTEAELWQELDQYFERKDLRIPGDIDKNQFKVMIEKKIGHHLSNETTRAKMIEFADKSNGAWKYLDVYDEAKSKMCKVLRKVTKS